MPSGEFQEKPDVSSKASFWEILSRQPNEGKTKAKKMSQFAVFVSVLLWFNEPKGAFGWIPGLQTKPFVRPVLSRVEAKTQPCKRKNKRQKDRKVTPIHSLEHMLAEHKRDYDEFAGLPVSEKEAIVAKEFDAVVENWSEESLDIQSPDIDPHKLFVAKLPYHFDEHNLVDLVESTVGTNVLKEVKIIRNPQTLKSKQYGFLEFHDSKDASAFYCKYHKDLRQGEVLELVVERGKKR